MYIFLTSNLRVWSEITSREFESHAAAYASGLSDITLTIEQDSTYKEIPFSQVAVTRTLCYRQEERDTLPGVAPQSSSPPDLPLDEDNPPLAMGD